MDAIQKIEAALAAGPAEHREWELWTSNSWRRIQGVIEPTIQRTDNHPDLHATIETLEYVVAVQPKNIREVLQTLASKEAELVRLREAGLKLVSATNFRQAVMCAVDFNAEKSVFADETYWRAFEEFRDLTQPPKEPT